MDTIQHIGRLQQRIAELVAGKDIDASHINVLLSPARQREFDAEWQRQQALRKQTKPATLNSYETLHRQAAALLARCETAAVKSKPEQLSLKKLQAKLCAAIAAALVEILRVTKKQATVAQWLDRDITATLTAVDLASGSTAKELRTITQLLTAQFELLPVLVTSRSEHRRVTVEERFGWLTKRDIRLRLLRETLAELEAGLVEELEREQRAREVRAARVFMDAFVTAKDAGRNAWSEANAALQRNGFRRLDVKSTKGMSKRDREVQEMEEALLKRFEAEATEEEREQLQLAREFDTQAGTKRRAK